MAEESVTGQKRTAVVGVTGGIAVYKACEVVRGLQKRGLRVKVAMTEHATKFVDPVTFRALTHEQVAVGLFDDPSDPIHHISLADEADVFVVAPCTANFIAKMACGIADNLMSTTALAMTCPVVVAPAMNVHMYEHPATQRNMEVLRGRGVRFVEAGSGYLACGYTGKGRMAEPDEVVDAVMATLDGQRERDLAGKRVLVTAGPTVEPLDPVRFLSNRSTGKMGFALANAAARRGASVTLVSGPSACADPAGVRVVHVETARQMLAACEEPFAQSDVAVFAAAVSDMRPERVFDRKMKKDGDAEALERVRFVENPDVLATLAKGKRDGQRVVGFAAETDDVVENARKKLAAKGADLVVANEVGHGKGFAQDHDEVWLVSDSGAEHVSDRSKDQVADAVLDAVVALG